MLYGSDQFGSDARFGNDGSTVLLLHCDGANASTTFRDDSKGNHTVTANGGAQISTAQFKFGGTSYLGSAAGDYLNLDGSSDFAFGTGDFTIEFWIRFAALGTVIFYDQRPSGVSGLYPTIYLLSNVLTYYTNSADRITGSSLSTSTWYHIALSRSGTSTKMFLNGTQDGSTYTDSNNYLNGASRPTIATSGLAPASNTFSGHIDELRVTKGLALFTGSFTPPPIPYGL